MSGPVRRAASLLALCCIAAAAGPEAVARAAPTAPAHRAARTSPVAAGAVRTEPAGGVRFSPADLLDDLRIAHDALEEGHPGVHRFTSRAAFDSAFDGAARKLDRPMDAWEFYRVLQPAVAVIHCGHTSAVLPESLQTAVNATIPLLPLQIRVIGRRAYVYRDLATTDRRLAGRELLSVNGIGTPYILDTFFAGLPRDGGVATSHAWRLTGWRFGGNLVRYYGMRSPFTLELARMNGGPDENVMLEGRVLPALDSLLAQRYPGDAAPKTPADLEFLDGGAIARLRIREFGGAMDDSGMVPLGGFIDAAFDSIHDRGSKALILDLRGNSGGKDELGKRLLSHLVDHPFDYYQDLVINKLSFSFGRYADHDSIPPDIVERRADGKYHFVTHPNWGRQQPAATHFDGKLIVLENGASFSTTCEFLSHIYDLKRATIVGEESGGAYVGNTSGYTITVTLPHSRTQLRLPLTRYDLALTRPGDPARGIPPDVSIKATIADLMAGADRDWNVALALARGATRQSEGAGDDVGR